MITNSIQAVQPIYNTYNTINKKQKKSACIEYFCTNCQKFHCKPMSESYLIKGKWVCRESVNKLMRGDE